MMPDEIEDLWLSEQDRPCLLRLAGATEAAWPEVRRAAAQAIREAATRWTAGVCDRAWCDQSAEQSELLMPYLRRIWRCLAYHAKHGTFAGLDSLIQTAERGGLVPGKHPENLLLDVVTAEALEQHQDRAARRFDQVYMPKVRNIAGRMGGDAAEIAVGNFAAELVLPRESGTPRIRNYQGRTTLHCWLRTVVANFVVSRSRTPSPLSGVEFPEPCAVNDAVNNDGRDCESLLGPMFRQLVSETSPDSRLLLTLLLVDQVPQRQVAAALGIDPGNVTRRRQRIVHDMLQRLGRLAAGSGQDRHVEECLELLLAGEDREAAQRLGAALSAALASQRTSPTGGKR